MSKTSSSIAIVGGGIGGLFAALSLLRDGHDVHVYEQTRSLREVGAGIVLTPNATRLLDNAGLGAILRAQAVAPKFVHQRRWQDGRTLLRNPLTQHAAASGLSLIHI